MRRYAPPSWRCLLRIFGLLQQFAPDADLFFRVLSALHAAVPADGFIFRRACSNLACWIGAVAVIASGCILLHAGLISTSVRGFFRSIMNSSVNPRTHFLVSFGRIPMLTSASKMNLRAAHTLSMSFFAVLLAHKKRITTGRVIFHTLV